MPPQVNTMSPEQQAMLMQMFKGLTPNPNGALSRGETQGMPPTTSPSMPEGMPMGMPGGPQRPQLGSGSGFMLPSGRAQASVPGAPYLPGAAKQPSGGFRANGVMMLPAAAMAITQKFHNDKVKKYQLLTTEYLTDKWQGLEEQAKKDPDVAKVLEKKKKEFSKMVMEAQKNPGSAAGAGIQNAYRQIQQEDAQQQQFQMVQQQMQEAAARMQAELMRANAEQQRARAYAQMADKKGEVSPEDEFRQQGQNQRSYNTIQARLKMNRDNITARQSNLREQLASLEKRAALHEAGANKRSAARIAQDQATNAMIKQYKNIETRYATLDREQTSLEKQMSDKPIGSWLTGQDDQYSAQAEAIAAQRAALDAQMDMIGASIQQMTQSGVIRKEQSAPASSGSGGGKGGPKVIDMTN